MMAYAPDGKEGEEGFDYFWMLIKRIDQQIITY